MASVRPTWVEIEGLTKRFRDVTDVDGVSIVIDPGTFLAVVGPTGSGKTTLLQLVAGLETPSASKTRFDGEIVDRLGPSERRVRMVFQDGALFPHLGVHNDRGISNLGFPLNLRRLSGEALRNVVEGIASRVGIGHRLFPRRPRELSSGERQKVAFGRALALPPRVLLLDEPFTNLDSVNRLRAQNELERERADHPVTTVHVTHSLSEAFSLADRVVVMDEGRFVQGRDTGRDRASAGEPACSRPRREQPVRLRRRDRTDVARPSARRRWASGGVSSRRRSIWTRHSVTTAARPTLAGLRPGPASPLPTPYPRHRRRMLEPPTFSGGPEATSGFRACRPRTRRRTVLAGVFPRCAGGNRWSGASLPLR